MHDNKQTIEADSLRSFKKARVWNCKNKLGKPSLVFRGNRCTSELANSQRNIRDSPFVGRDGHEESLPFSKPSRFIDDDELFVEVNLGPRKRSGSVEQIIGKPETDIYLGSNYNLQTILSKSDLQRISMPECSSRRGSSMTGKDMTTDEIRQQHIASNFNSSRVEV